MTGTGTQSLTYTPVPTASATPSSTRSATLTGSTTHTSSATRTLLWYIIPVDLVSDHSLSNITDVDLYRTDKYNQSSSGVGMMLLMSDAQRLALAQSISSTESIVYADATVSYVVVKEASLWFPVPEVGEGTTTSVFIREWGDNTTKAVVTSYAVDSTGLALTGCSSPEAFNGDLAGVFQVDRIDDQGGLTNGLSVTMQIYVNEDGYHELDMYTCDASNSTMLNVESDGGVLTRESDSVFAVTLSHTSAFAVIRRTFRPGLYLSTTAITTTEVGGEATFTVGLTNQPHAAVTLTITSTNPKEVTVAPSTLTVQPADWRSRLEVTATGQLNSASDGAQEVELFVIATAADPEYDGLVRALAATNTDGSFSCADGVQNGDETGVDCGGTCAACQAATVDAPMGTIFLSVTVQSPTIAPANLLQYFKWICNYYFLSPCEAALSSTATASYFIAARLPGDDSTLALITESVLADLGSTTLNFKRLQAPASQFTGLIIGERDPPTPAQLTAAIYSIPNVGLIELELGAMEAVSDLGWAYPVVLPAADALCRKAMQRVAESGSLPTLGVTGVSLAPPDEVGRVVFLPSGGSLHQGADVVALAANSGTICYTTATVGGVLPLAACPCDPQELPSNVQAPFQIQAVGCTATSAGPLGQHVWPHVDPPAGPIVFSTNKTTASPPPTPNP